MRWNEFERAQWHCRVIAFFHQANETKAMQCQTLLFISKGLFTSSFQQALILLSCLHYFHDVLLQTFNIFCTWHWLACVRHFSEIDFIFLAGHHVQHVHIFHLLIFRVMTFLPDSHDSHFRVMTLAIIGHDYVLQVRS